MILILSGIALGTGDMLGVVGVAVVYLSLSKGVQR